MPDMWGGGGGSKCGPACQVNMLPNLTRFSHLIYRKGPKFSDARKRRCNLPKIQTKRPNLSVFRQQDAME